MAIVCGAPLLNLSLTGQACSCKSKAMYVDKDGIPSCGKHKNGSRFVAECSICMEGCICTETLVTVCKHMFHSKCIEQWLEQQLEKTGNALCPLCRSSLIVKIRKPLKTLFH